MYLEPQTSEDWQEVAAERRSDAAALHSTQRSVATLYFFGFVIECYAKALCAAYGKPVPKGRNGHDIIAILSHAGVGRMVLPSTVRKYAEERDISIRYQAKLPSDIDFEADLEAARRLARWCMARLGRISQRGLGRR